MPEIEKGLPIPPERSILLGGKREEFQHMDVGDSKFFPCTMAERKNWASSAQGFGRRTGRKFISRSVVNAGVEGVRIWRTA